MEAEHKRIARDARAILKQRGRCVGTFNGTDGTVCLVQALVEAANRGIVERPHPDVKEHWQRVLDLVGEARLRRVLGSTRSGTLLMIPVCRLNNEGDTLAASEAGVQQFLTDLENAD